MSHWSQTAQESANRSMGNGATDAPVRECIDRDWEPIAEITPLPDWQPLAEILDDPQAASTAAGSTH